jgi:hypothetical protein
MFNLIMRWFDWADGNGTIGLDRLFEYTDNQVADMFRENGNVLLDRMARLPCLFMNEGRGDELAYVGSVLRPRVVNREIHFEYVLDAEVAPLQNRVIYANRNSLDMPEDFEFSRNHWAIKNVDLFRFLFRNAQPRRQRPTVFRIEHHENIEPTLVSAMMPFDAAFSDVYTTIQASAESVGLRCRRADDIWENPAIIQDVVSLIDRSRIVVCDCSGRNPNVFYEAGIAHTLGREVILIAQSANDIPFDLRHLRYIPYLNNNEGRLALADALQGRMQTVVGH